MDNKRYLQLSISAFITAVVIGLGSIIPHIKNIDTWVPFINGVLIGISILFGLYFFYKYTISGSEADGYGWVNNLVEKVSEVIPEIALIPPIIVGVIFVTQNISNIETDIDPAFKTQISSNFTEINNNLSTILSTLSTYEQRSKSNTTQINEISATIITKLTTNEQKIDNMTCCSPTEDTSTEFPTITPTPEVIGCVITFGLNVRKSAGVTATPSNHANIWLRNDACLTILGTSTTDPEWVHVQFEGFVRLKADETVYVGTVTPTPILTPSP